MPGINYVAVAVAAVAAFVLSFVYYMALGSQMRKLQSYAATDATATQSMPAWKMIAEVCRNLILACAIAHLVVMIGIANWKSAIHWGAWLWVGFPLVLLSGSVMWENVPWKLAAIHAGDWFIKVLLISAILGAWR